MDKPVVRLRVCSEPYDSQDLIKLAEPLRSTYEVREEEVGEGGGLFGLDLNFLIPALTVTGVFLKPFAEGMMKRLGEGFADLILKHVNAAKQAGDVSLGISNFPPDGYTSPHINRTFGMRAAVQVSAKELNQQQNLHLVVAERCEAMEASFSRVWQLAQEGKLHVKAMLVHFDSNPPNIYRVVQCHEDLQLSSPRYEADLFAHETPVWRRIEGSPRKEPWHPPSVPTP